MNIPVNELNPFSMLGEMRQSMYPENRGVFFSAEKIARSTNRAGLLMSVQKKREEVNVTILMQNEMQLHTTQVSNHYLGIFGKR